MFLAVDIGNTKINISVFDNDDIVGRFSFDTTKIDDAEFCKTQLKKITEKFDINDCGIISVVNNAEKVLKSLCDDTFGIESVILDTAKSNKIKIAGNNPASVGMDRLANVYAVLDYDLPAIIVDIGTAITFDILSKNCEFLGGIIMPGLNMELKALAEGTSKLPEIKIKEPEKVIGNTTETCILSGVICGTASAVDGLLMQCIKELGECHTVVLTGGQSELISKYMNYPFTCINKDLTMFGIKALYYKRK